MGLHDAPIEWPRPLRDGYVSARPAVDRAVTIDAVDRSVPERVLAMIRDVAIIIVCLGVIYAGFKIYAALDALGDQLQQVSTPQPCLIDPNAPGCGR